MHLSSNVCCVLGFTDVLSLLVGKICIRICADDWRVCAAFLSHFQVCVTVLTARIASAALSRSTLTWSAGIRNEAQAVFFNQTDKYPFVLVCVGASVCMGVSPTEMLQ